MRERILLPLGLNDTLAGDAEKPTTGDRVQRRSGVTDAGAKSRRLRPRGSVPQRDSRPPHATWRGLPRGSLGLLDRKSTEVLSPNTLREMHRVHWIDPDFATPWGLGFAVWRDKEKTFVGHGGSVPGSRASC